MGMTSIGAILCRNRNWQIIIAFDAGLFAACLSGDVLLGDDTAGQTGTLRVILPEGEDREGLARHQIAEAAKIFDDMHTVAFAVPVHLLVFRVTADAGTVDTDETYSPGQQGVDELRG